MKPLLLTLNLLCGADAASTHVGLVQGRNATVTGTREGFLPTQNPFVIDGIIAGQAVASSLALSWLDKHGHSRLARVIAWTSIGVHAVVVTRNIKAIRSIR